MKPQYDVYWETTSFDFISPLSQYDDTSSTYLHGVSWDEYDVYNGSWKGASLTVKIDNETYVFSVDVNIGDASEAEFYYKQTEGEPLRYATGLEFINIDPVEGRYYLSRYYYGNSPTYTPGSQHTIQFISLETATAVYNIKQM